MKNQEDSLSFESAKGFIFKLILVVPSSIFLLISFIFIGLYFSENLSVDFGFFLIFFLFAISGILIWRGLNYKIHDGVMMISVYALVLYRQPINKIKAISKKRKSSYVYGLSNDTITLKVKNDEVNISPKHKQKFIEKLLEINPRIKLEGSIQKVI